MAESSRSIRRAAALAGLGAIGAGLGGVLTYAIRLSVVRAGVESLPFLIVAQGFCFVPLGVGMGLSVARYCGLPNRVAKGLICGMALGGGLYGAASFFSIAGGVVGWLLFLFSVAASAAAGLRSVTRGLMVGAAGLLLVMVLLAILAAWVFVSERAFVFLWAVFAPALGMAALAGPALLGLVSGFYVFNVIVLLTLGSGEGRRSHSVSHPSPAADRTV